MGEGYMAFAVRRGMGADEKNWAGTKARKVGGLAAADVSKNIWSKTLEPL
jgi:hypothetical protein